MTDGNIAVSPWYDEKGRPKIIMDNKTTMYTVPAVDTLQYQEYEIQINDLNNQISTLRTQIYDLKRENQALKKDNEELRDISKYYDF